MGRFRAKTQNGTNGDEKMICQLNLKIEELAALYANSKISILTDNDRLYCPCCGEDLRNSQGSFYQLDYFYQLVDLNKTWNV